MDDLITRLIYEYQLAANSKLEQMKNQFSILNPVRAVIEKKIPRTGTLKDGTVYRVHGIGVSFESKGTSVDVDLDQKGSYAGFDAWRLFSFAKENGYGALTSDYIEQAIYSMVQRGLVRKQDEQMISHLYTWTELHKA